MRNPHDAERKFVTAKMGVLWLAATVALAVASVPFSGDVEAVLVASAAFFGLGAVLVLSSLVGYRLVDRVTAWLSR